MYGHVMALRRGTQSNVVALSNTVEAKQAAAVEAPEQVTASPLYGVAMLKIAMELKKADPAPLDALITGVLKTMRLDERTFRNYLEANGGLLRSIAQKRSY